MHFNISWYIKDLKLISISYGIFVTSGVFLYLRVSGEGK